MAASSSAQSSHLDPLRLRPERRLPADWSLPGHWPAQEASCLGVGKALMSVPISATITGNVAVVHYRYQIATENYKKERETVTGRYTDILIKQNGRWQFLSWSGGDDPKK